MNANFPTVSIDVIIDRHTAKEVLHAVLHSILFHRLFGTVKPQTFEVLDVTMPGVADPEMEALVNEKVDVFWKALESGTHKRGQIIVTFSEKRPKKSWFQVYMGEEDVTWEQWIVNAELRQPKSEQDRLAFNATLSTALSTALRAMLTHTASAARVPPITTSAGISPFPMRIGVRVGGVEVA
ncbi:DUF1649-domain-containing protein [Leucogyrophana mollusca]|uniref:DUF1649-domain-containing protein n=1 Tax=Leucogyrophana mollusca TaxID=85980 RepID=A0ACB8B9E1_9AGAM|nr:DUF1649-domain-containing protein [Leucogyrophana mollusca]